MPKTIKGLIAVMFLALLVWLDLSPWANALLLFAFFGMVLYGPAIFGRRA